MTKKNVFSKETIKSLTELGIVLRNVHNRLVVEGKVKVANGKVIFLYDKQKEKSKS